MRRYTTPTLTILINDYLSQAHIYITFKQGNTLITIDSPDCVEKDGGTEIYVNLSQEQTSQFVVGPVQIQANWIWSSGSRGATEIAYIQMTENLLTKTLEWG